MANESKKNGRKIVILSNYNSNKLHSENLMDYFKDVNFKDSNIDLSHFTYRRLLIDGKKNYLFNPPDYPEFMTLKQVLSRDVEGVILFIETSAGIFETDLEIINLIAEENIPHVLFANRDDFNQFEMEIYVEGVLIIPTIAQEGIGINDGLKMLLKLIDNQEKEQDLTENHDSLENREPLENHNTLENQEALENQEPLENHEALENQEPLDSTIPETEFYKLRFFCHPVELDNLKKSLAKFGFSNLTLIDIKYHNYQEEKTETYRGNSYDLQLPPKIELMMIIKKEEIEYVIEAIKAVKTEDISEKLFISPVEDIIRIRTTEKGEHAID
ncbi:MAG: hypothetical protein PWQ15_1354 [Methanobacterium sp.]|uniref:P-II family nitrogen regulator n=2 Tax=Methanobacterium TaxID=2160 RepID=UPI0003C938E3|nr:P-II family nitrogen regulator [Methanobacterium sp.]MDI3550251.1 hypothetical protein [Methanobacterium sp.]CDG64452.1 hypothetical protein MBMB1_0342 [Methanobacterium sp. MB1]